MPFVDKVNKNGTGYDVHDSRIDNTLTATATELNALHGFAPSSASNGDIVVVNNGALSTIDGDSYIAATEKNVANGVAGLDANSKIAASAVPDLSATYVAVSTKGVAGGVAELDSTGKVPSAQLPAFVDDVLEGRYVNETTFNDPQGVPYVPARGKIYVDTQTNISYRWSGSIYVAISQSLALGTTHESAGYGDESRAAFNHSNLTSGNPHGVTAADVGAVTSVNGFGPGDVTITTVAYAEDLYSPDRVSDSDSYIYRTAGGNASISTGNAILTQIEGNATQSAAGQTITVATPTSFKAVAFNLFNHAVGYAHVVGGNLYNIEGSFTSAAFATTVGGTTTPITPTSTTVKGHTVPNSFTPESDGYVYLTGADSTSTMINLVWSGYMVGTEYQAYSESSIVIPTKDANGNNLPTATYGMPSVGDVRDILSFSANSYTQKIGHMAYTAENLARVQEMGVAYIYDNTHIFYVLSSPIVYTLSSISGMYDVDDFGTEEFVGTAAAVYATMSYGQNLRDKLRRDVVTIAQQTLSASEKAQVNENIGSIPMTEKGAANGVATLNAEGKISSSQIGDFVKTVNAIGPDASGNVEITNVATADNLISPDNTHDYGLYHFRSSGGSADLSDGDAGLSYIKGYAINPTRVQENSTVTANSVSEGTPFTATLDDNVFMATTLGAVTGKYTFAYNGTAWTYDGSVVDLADYGITVTSGTPAELDEIVVDWNRNDNVNVHASRVGFTVAIDVAAWFASTELTEEQLKTTQTFVYTVGTGWKLKNGANTVSMANLGITITGNPGTNDEIVVNPTAKNFGITGHSDTLTNVAVNEVQWRTNPDFSGKDSVFTFVYSAVNSVWKYNDNTVSFTDLGITYTGDPEDKDYITVSDTTAKATISRTVQPVDATVVKSTWMTTAYKNTSGDIHFDYDGTNWKIGLDTVTLSDYGVALGTDAVSGDRITVTHAIEITRSITCVDMVGPTNFSARISNMGQWRTATQTQIAGTTTTYTFKYDLVSKAWKLNSTIVSLDNYGITVTGEYGHKDEIIVVYTKYYVGSIQIPQPTSWRATGFNAWSESVGNARVVGGLRYNMTGLGTMTLTPDDGTAAVTVTTESYSAGGRTFNNSFIPAKSGMITARPDGTGTSRMIYLIWSGTRSNMETYEAYTESTITFPTTGTNPLTSETVTLPSALYGMPAVGSVGDVMNFDRKQYTKNIGRLNFNASNLALVQSYGCAYDYDDSYIYYVLDGGAAGSPVVYNFTLSTNIYTVCDWGHEEIVGNGIDMYAETIYGQNLRDKLRRDVLTISAQSLTSAQKTQVKSNLGFVSQDDTIAIAHGGTGLTSSPSMLTNLGTTSAANVLQASPRPGVTGTLPVGNGGTGATSFTSSRMLVGNGTSAITTLSNSAANRVVGINTSSQVSARPLSYGRAYGTGTTVSGVTIAANTTYYCTNTSGVTSISVTLGTPEDVNTYDTEWRIIFKAGSSVSLAISKPSGYTMYVDDTPSFTSGYYYEISVCQVGPSALGMVCKEWSTSKTF